MPTRRLFMAKGCYRLNKSEVCSSVTTAWVKAATLHSKHGALQMLMCGKKTGSAAWVPWDRWLRMLATKPTSECRSLETYVASSALQLPCQWQEEQSIARPRHTRARLSVRAASISTAHSLCDLFPVHRHLALREMRWEPR